MKKLVVSILAFIYLSTSSGFAVYLHYCMGKVDSVNLFQSEGCAKCGMKVSKSKDCCKDELKVVKLEDSHQAKTHHISFISPFTLLQYSYKQISEPIHPELAYKQAIRNNSPPLSGHELCIKNSVFRI